MPTFDELLQLLSAHKKSKERNQPKWESTVKPLEEIWAMDDTEALIEELYQHIGEKCQFGDNMTALSAPERVIFVIGLVETEVNNGGFSQFFFNSAGAFANEAADAFLAIGAGKTAAICKKAVSIFGGTVPPDRDAREDLMDDNDEAGRILEECDDAYFACEEALYALRHAYVMEHKAAFT